MQQPFQAAVGITFSWYNAWNGLTVIDEGNIPKCTGAIRYDKICGLAKRRYNEFVIDECE